MQVILADDQAIFREGLARVLASEPSIDVVAECENVEQLREASRDRRKTVVVLSASMTSDTNRMLGWIQQAGHRAVLILELDASPDESFWRRPEGLLWRSVAGRQLIDCVYTVAAGERYLQRSAGKAMPFADQVGARAARRLTPKELQIVALIAEGCKNKEIANQLGTKEQVVKNYLRNIYGKTGVSDRLELALFTLRHHVLAEVVEAARLSLVRTA